jgi:hypothetical protein
MFLPATDVSRLLVFATKFEMRGIEILPGILVVLLERDSVCELTVMRLHLLGFCCGIWHFHPDSGREREWLARRGLHSYLGYRTQHHVSCDEVEIVFVTWADDGR